MVTSVETKSYANYSNYVWIEKSSNELLSKGKDFGKNVYCNVDSSCLWDMRNASTDKYFFNKLLGEQGNLPYIYNLVIVDRSKNHPGEFRKQFQKTEVTKT